MNPLNRFTSIRARLGSAIVAAVALTIGVMYALISLTLPKTGVWWQLLLAGGVAGVVALVLVRILARGMTKPLRDMEGAAVRMARGDYSERVRASSRDEVGRLAEAFNHMAAELERMERLRRELVANVSHELKTPISAIRAHLENLLEGVEEPNPATLDIMVRQSERLSRLIDQLLDLSRLESGDVPLDLEPLALVPLVDQAVAEARLARPAAGVEIRAEVPATLPALTADRQRIHQVLFNLLDNAIRFTPAGGTVRVLAGGHNGSVEITVEDTGPGIAEDQMPLVFERFYRVDASRSRSDGGAGLGLAISRSIVDAHGGKIWAAPAAGGGARFTFSLPAGTTPRRNA